LKAILSTYKNARSIASAVNSALMHSCRSLICRVTPRSDAEICYNIQFTQHSKQSAVKLSIWW